GTQVSVRTCRGSDEGAVGRTSRVVMSARCPTVNVHPVARPMIAATRIARRAAVDTGGGVWRTPVGGVNPNALSAGDAREERRRDVPPEARRQMQIEGRVATALAQAAPVRVADGEVMVAAEDVVLVAVLAVIEALGKEVLDDQPGRGRPAGALSAHEPRDL